MFANLSNWLDSRTGYRKLVSALLIEEIPGGAKWRYVWGSALAFVFAVQLVTGVLLMTSYSASDTTAWSSVYFIQYEMDFGWLVRGLHHFGSQTMVVLLAVHMLQVVIAGAHLPPREINWWLGLALLACVLGLSLTGYLLPWDQKGYFATQVATNIAGNLPGVGSYVSKVVVGGPEYGNQTLTRFYALHVGVLPPLVIVLMIAHIVVFRRHGVTAPAGAQGEGWFWPDQAFRDMLASLVIFGVMIALVLYGHGHKIEADPGAERGLWDRVAHAGRDGLGANLDAPADRQTESYPARPEWYFLFLFQFLKYFPGDQELIGSVVIPNGVLLLLAVLPLLAFGRQARGGMRTFAHAVSVLVIVALFGGVGYLTYAAVAADRGNKDFQDAQKEADKQAARAVNLAHDGIPADGAVYLLRHDPLTRGPELFKKNCGTCHNYNGPPKDSPERPASASDLAGFGSADWIYRLLSHPAHEDFFGRPGFTAMQEYIDSNFPNVALTPEDEAKLTADERSALAKDRQDLQALAAWLALHPRAGSPEAESEAFRTGLHLFQERDCKQCHTYEGQGGKRGPDLTGYGDAEWVRLMVMAPAHPLRYGNRNKMPAFRDLEGPAAAVTQAEAQRAKALALQEVQGSGKKAEQQRKDIEQAHQLMHLSDLDRELIIRWLVQDDRVVLGGKPISGPPRK